VRTLVWEFLTFVVYDSRMLPLQSNSLGRRLAHAKSEFRTSMRQNPSASRLRCRRQECNMGV
jgi:hypothetical protein